MKRINLSEVLGSVKSFSVKDPAAWIVGPMALHGKATEIDVMLNMHPSECDSTMARSIRQHLVRSLPSSIASRIRWLYNDGAGPSASYVPLFSISSSPINSEVNLNASSSIVPLKFFRQLKARQGRLRRDMFNIESLQSIIPSTAYPVEVNMKYDGIRAQVHCLGKSVLILTEDGGDITSRFPSFVADLLAHDMDMVLDVEIVGSVNNIHMGRSDVAGYIHTKSDPDDSAFVAYVHDMLYHVNLDIHEFPRSKRMELLYAHGSFGSKFKVIPFRIANNKDELKNHVSYFSSMSGSEGAMIKSLDSPYDLDGLSSRWWKFKKDFVVNARVLRVMKYGPVYSYLCTIGQDVPVGQTYNTTLKADAGDIIQVAFGNLNRYADGDRVWYNWVFPRVLGLQENLSDPDSLDDADFLNAESKGLNESRSFPVRYSDVVKSDIKTLSSMELIEHHVHLHDSFASSKEKHLLKQRHDLVAAELQSRNIFHNTPMLLSGSDFDSLAYYRKFMKAPVDQELFDAFDEFVASSRCSKYCLSGDRINLGDVVYILLKPEFPTRVIPSGNAQLSQANGLYEPGIVKVCFKELFMKGPMSGTYHLRKIPQSGNYFDAGVVPFEWRIDRAPGPYILSDDALRKLDFPIGLDSSSHLPYELECKVPAEHRWWGLDISMDHAASRIKAAREHLVSTMQLSSKSISSSAPLRFERSQGLYDYQVEHIVSLSDPSMRMSRGEIAAAVGCGISTVYSWQKKYELL